MNNKVNIVLSRLTKSKFRNSFHLKQKDIDYINDKGLDTIKSHACDFIFSRLRPEVIDNDGKQTPMKGHPVFIAQHATATCCRSCLYKWHHIEMNKELTKDEMNYIYCVIIFWIKREMENNNEIKHN